MSGDVQGEEGLDEDTLFLACTRPALFLGVPLEAAMLNAGIVTVAFVLVKNPLVLGIGVATHWIFRQLAGLDHNIFRVWGLWVWSRGWARNAEFWGGASVAPLPLTPAKKAAEVRHVR